MKITKTDLKQMIIEVLSEEGGTLPDIEALGTHMDTKGIDDTIHQKIGDQPEEFIELINLVSSYIDDNKLPAAEQLLLLKKAVLDKATTQTKGET